MSTRPSAARRRLPPLSDQWDKPAAEWRALREHLALAERHLAQGLKQGDAVQVGRALAQGACWTRSPHCIYETLSAALRHQSPGMLGVLLEHGAPADFVWPKNARSAEGLVRLAVSQDAAWAIPTLVAAGMPVSGEGKDSAWRCALRSGNTATVEALLECSVLSDRWPLAPHTPCPIESHPLFLAKGPALLAWLWRRSGGDETMLWATTKQGDRYGLHDHLAEDPYALVVRQKGPKCFKATQGEAPDAEATVALVAQWGQGWQDHHLGMACAASTHAMVHALDAIGLDWSVEHQGMTPLAWLEARGEHAAHAHWSAVLAARGLAQVLEASAQSAAAATPRTKKVRL